jgi:hypothetical protein
MSTITPLPSPGSADGHDSVALHPQKVNKLCEQMWIQKGRGIRDAHRGEGDYKHVSAPHNASSLFDELDTRVARLLRLPVAVVRSSEPVMTVRYGSGPSARGHNGPHYDAQVTAHGPRGILAHPVCLRLTRGCGWWDVCARTPTSSLLCPPCCCPRLHRPAAHQPAPSACSRF